MQNKMKQKATTLLRTLCATLLLLGATLPMRAEAICNPSSFEGIAPGDVAVLSGYKNSSDIRVIKKTSGEGGENDLAEYRAEKIALLEAFANELGIGEDVYGKYEAEIGNALSTSDIDDILTKGERAVAIAYVTKLAGEHSEDIDLEYFKEAIDNASIDQLPNIIDEADGSTDLVQQKADATSALSAELANFKEEYPDFCDTYEDLVTAVYEACLARINAAPSGSLLDEAVSLNEDDFDLLDDKASFVAELYELHARIADYNPEEDVVAILAATSREDAASIYLQVVQTYALEEEKIDFKAMLQELAAQYGKTLSDEDLQSIDGADDDYELQEAFKALYVQILGDMSFTIGDILYAVVETGNDQYGVLDGEAFFEDGLEYQNARDVEVENFTYARTFANTNWQPLYVPFSLSYDDWKEGYDVAAINNFHEYTDADGELTSVELEVRFVTSGTLLPNHPYLIRAHEGSNEQQWFRISNCTLHSSVENSIDCSSVERTYTFTGTYSSMTGLKTMGAIFMSGGKLCMAADDDVVLKGQRWYLTVEDRAPQVIDAAASARPVSYTIRVTGEGADDATSIGVITTPMSDAADILAPAGLYNLQGQRVSDDYRGLVIENGRKVYRK